ncbi:MAG: Colistin resistance protein EmrA [Candidatus Celerinatantimonas neptuna]|nr:MAG: Colistin resistance protein EmrA [Candidatus Celerinatantimonas neptuna]
MKRPTKRHIVGVISLVLIAGFSYWYFYARYFESTDNAYIHCNITNLSSRLTGVVVANYIKDNHQVKEGQLLVQLDSRSEKVALDKAQASLAQRVAELGNMKASYQMQLSTIHETQEALNSAKVRMHYAGTHYQRYFKLQKHLYVSQGDVDTAHSNLLVNQANVAQARANLQTQQDKLNVIHSEIQQAKADVKQAKANVEQAKLNFSYTRIRSPINGVIGNRSLDVGKRISAGETIASIVSESSAWIQANFKETQQDRMRVGQPVRILIDAYPGKVLHGRIDSFSPATGSTFALLPPDNASGNFTKIVQRVPVKIVFDHPEHFFSGLSAYVTVDTRKKS